MAQDSVLTKQDLYSHIVQHLGKIIHLEPGDKLLINDSIDRVLGDYYNSFPDYKSQGKLPPINPAIIELGVYCHLRNYGFEIPLEEITSKEHNKIKDEHAVDTDDYKKSPISSDSTPDLIHFLS